MTILGTIAYMAPELIEGRKFYNELIDVYALTITLWQIWTGLEPFADETTFSLYDLILSGTHPPLPKNSPEGFNNILEAAWQGDPDKRINSKELLEDITRVVSNFMSKLHGKEASLENSQLMPPLSHDPSSISINKITSKQSSLLPTNVTDQNHFNQQLPNNDNNDNNNDEENSMIISNKALEMLGNSTFIDECSSSDVDEQSISSSGMSPELVFNGWEYERSSSENNPIHPLPLQQSHNSTSKLLFPNNNTHNKFHSTLKEKKSHKKLIEIKTEYQHNHHDHDHKGNNYNNINTNDNENNNDNDNNIAQMDLYQSYARNSTTEQKKNPIFQFFSNKRSSFW